MWIGDDRGGAFLDLVEIELRQLGGSAVARVEVADPLTDVGAGRRLPKLLGRPVGQWKD